MALSLGELVAAARQSSLQPSVTDRIQNGMNQGSAGLGSILGYLYGGKLLGAGQNGQQLNGGMLKQQE